MGNIVTYEYVTPDVVEVSRNAWDEFGSGSWDKWKAPRRMCGAPRYFESHSLILDPSHFNAEGEFGKYMKLLQ